MRSSAVAGSGSDVSLEPPGCTECGACCFSSQRDYILVFGVDRDRMDARALSFTEVRGDRQAMRMSEGRCAALVVDAAGPSFKCAIYEARPDVCRSLARGSGDCREQRVEKRHLPMLAAREVLASSSR